MVARSFFATGPRQPKFFNGGVMICRSIRMSILLAAMMVTLGPPKAQAQITGPGPYYAVPSWDQTLPTATRFIILSNMNGEAVLDRETGLVWERSVSFFQVPLLTAKLGCFSLTVGGRRGWRLPRLDELMTLFDGNGPSVALVSGHPFDLSNVLPGPDPKFWTSSTHMLDALELTLALALDGSVEYSLYSGTALHRWCVRGQGGQ
jgi:hypothetical protein